ncbi:MAG: cellulose biosynthesis protein BcsS [Alphaproteobacteria bacterium]|nr:cellulose biosynthesis protein BcsS [Alphaproteobacteria bacterium]
MSRALVLAVLVAASAALADVPAALAADPTVSVFTGGQALWNSSYAYAGGMAALGGSIYSDGLRLRVSGGIGQYSYDIQPGVRQGVGYQQGDAMAGYRLSLGPANVTLFGGVEVQNHDDSNPNATTRGTVAGGKGQVELYSPLGPNAFVFALGSLSSNYTSYYSFAKAGYRVNERLSIGPQGSADGSVTYNHAGAGAFVSYNFGRAELSVSSGYEFDLRGAAPGSANANGVYGAVDLSFKF